MYLLSDEASNAKLSKNSGINSGWQTSILYLAPSTSAGTGVDVCPAASAGCKKACLYTAGRGAMASVQEARIRKTVMLVENPVEFMRALADDLELLVRRQLRTGVRQAVRLNGTSDLQWESIAIIRNGVEYSGVPQAFPELQFYDYTKLAARISGRLPQNYKLTFSQSEINTIVARRLAVAGHNVAVVFTGTELPTEYHGRPVIDGTAHDMRFLDPVGVVVGLLAKGQARKDTSGFVVTVSGVINSAA